MAWISTDKFMDLRGFWVFFDGFLLLLLEIEVDWTDMLFEGRRTEFDPDFESFKDFSELLDFLRATLNDESANFGDFLTGFEDFNGNI